MTKYTIDETEAAVNFYKVIKQDIHRFIPASLCIIGEAMEATNAETMVASTKATLNGKRYEIKSTYTINQLIDDHETKSINCSV